MMSPPTHDRPYAAILQLLDQIAVAFDAGAEIAALALVYAGIDTMALLSCPVGQAGQTGDDFKAWVDRYLKADPASPYQYVGADVYAARCAVLHAYGSESGHHRRANPPKKFGYTDNGAHWMDPSGQNVVISIATFIRDFGAAVQAFLGDARGNPDFRQRIDSRMDSLLLLRMLGDQGSA